MKTRSGIRRYAEGGIVNVAAPPVGMTDLSANAVQTQQSQQASPYMGFSDTGASESGPIGTGITQPTGTMMAKNRVTGAMGVAPEAQGFAKGGMVKKKSSKGGLVQVRGYGKARSKPCKIC